MITDNPVTKSVSDCLEIASVNETGLKLSNLPSCVFLRQEKKKPHSLPKYHKPLISVANIMRKAFRLPQAAKEIPGIRKVENPLLEAITALGSLVLQNDFHMPTGLLGNLLPANPGKIGQGRQEWPLCLHGFQDGGTKSQRG